ncbi:MAG: TetR/AcrR family transcriptional regulator [Mycobacteriaceae bacterium]|nr:TetR/AcrR family transcriptional regulator [Mycobacteriaceae bacterium]
MASEPTKSRRRDPDRRARILAAAAALAARHGFHAVAMDEIGDEAGIVGSGVYRHFSDKQNILVALLDQDMARLQSEARTSWPSLVTTAGPSPGWSAATSPSPSTIAMCSPFTTARPDRRPPTADGCGRNWLTAASDCSCIPRSGLCRRRVLPQWPGRRPPHRAARHHRARVPRRQPDQLSAK